MEFRLTQVKSALDEISQEVSQGRVPATILKDFKLSVDQLRVTIWAILTFEEQASKQGKGADVALGNKLVEFRIKRIIQMLAELETDIENRRIAAEHPDLKALTSSMNGILDAVAKLNAN